MTDPRGLLKVTARGQEWRLWLGMSVLADLQAKHGDDVLAKLDPPSDAGPGWMPSLQIIVDLFLGALQRYHVADADAYLVDEIIAENAGAFDALMAAAFPDQQDKPSGNRKRPKRAA